MEEKIVENILKSCIFCEKEMDVIESNKEVIALVYLNGAMDAIQIIGNL